MQTYSQAGYRVVTVMAFLLAASGCSPEEEPPLDRRAQAGSTEKQPPNLGSEVNPIEDSASGERSSRAPAPDASGPEESRLPDEVDANGLPAAHERDRPDEEPTIISTEGLRPVSPEELLNHPLMKELARRQAAEIEDLEIKYDYGGAFGMDGIADGARAYTNGRMVGEAKALRLVGDTPSTIEVEVKHYSPSGELAYRGITLFVVGNVWKPGDDPVLPGALSQAGQSKAA